jgi:hypothetical protein
MKLSTTWSRAGSRLFLIGTLTLVLTSMAHAADWSSIGLYEQGTFYIDRDSLTRDGNTRKVWTMLDYRQPQTSHQGKAYRSTRSLLQFDCRDHRVKTLSLSRHTGTRLQGDTLTSEGVIADWQPIPADTPMAKMAWVVCGQ